MVKQDLKYKIAINLIPGIGSVLGKKILAYTGSVEGIFKENARNLIKIPGIGRALVNEIISNNALTKAEEELEFIQKYNIKPIFFTDKEFPERLKYCQDSPLMLYVKGDIDLNHTKFLSIVGTRKASTYGKELCNNLVEELAKNHHDVIIVSGLAYGIDICAHKAALKYDLPTIAILAHGFNTIYPPLHKQEAKKIISKGALITEFLSHTKPEKNNFIKRNRIIAGISDATIVIESAKKGGALITADIANSYSKDVFAFPGRTTDKYSNGCNWLIKTNRAALIENASDLEYLLGWDIKQNIPEQKKIFIELNENEQLIFDLLKEKQELDIDTLCNQTQFTINKISPYLLNLEFAGLIKTLPGKIYRICN